MRQRRGERRNVRCLEMANLNGREPEQTLGDHGRQTAGPPCSHGVSKSRTQLSNEKTTIILFCFYLLSCWVSGITKGPGRVLLLVHGWAFKKAVWVVCGSPKTFGAYLPSSGQAVFCVASVIRIAGSALPPSPAFSCSRSVQSISLELFAYHPAPCGTRGPRGGRAGPVFLTAILGGCFSGGLPLALCPSPLRLGHLAHLQTSISSPEEVFTLCWASKPPGTGFNTALEAHSHQLTLVRTGGTQVPALPTDHPDASLPPHPTTHIWSQEMLMSSIYGRCFENYSSIISWWLISILNEWEFCYSSSKDRHLYASVEMGP